MSQVFQERGVLFVFALVCQVQRCTRILYDLEKEGATPLKYFMKEVKKNETKKKVSSKVNDKMHLDFECNP